MTMPTENPPRESNPAAPPEERLTGDPIALSPAPARRMYAFAMPRIGSAILLGIVGFALFNLYTAGYQLDEYRVGVAIALGYVAIALSQFLLGWISDKKYTRWGRRKPYIIVLTPVLVLAFIMLLMPSLVLTDPSEDVLFGWLVFWDVVFEAAYGLTTPYQSWMAEQFAVGDRPKVSQVQNTFAYVGNGTMLIFTMVVLTDFTAQVSADPTRIPPEFFWSCIAFCAIFVASFYACAFLMPVEPPPKRAPDLVNNLKTILKNRNYLAVVVMQGLASLAWIMLTTVMLSYTQVVLAFGMMEYIIAGVALLVGILSFLYVWRRLIGRWGKTKSLLALYLFAAAILPFSLLGLAPMASTLVFGILFMLGLAAIMGGWFLFPAIMYADLAEDDEKTTDELKAGIYTGFPSIILNLFQALGTYVLGVVTSMAEVTVRGQTFSLGYVLWGPLCAAILVGVFFYSKYLVQIDFEWERRGGEE